MAKKRSRPDAISVELAQLRGEEKPAQKLNLGDGASLKRALDEEAAQVVKDEGKEENTLLQDIKIGTGLFTCALAALAQFYPVKYPDNSTVLMLCVGLYIVATLALNLAFGGMDGDVFFLSTPKGKQVMCLMSKLPRYSEHYELIIGRRQSIWSQKLLSSVSAKLNVTDYFDTDGQLVAGKFDQKVVSLLREFEQRHSKKQ